MVMLSWSVNLTTLFLSRHRCSKGLTSTSCTYFRQKLTTALLESAEGETKVCGRIKYRTRDLWLLSQTGDEGLDHILTYQVGGGGDGGGGGLAEVD